MIRYNKLITVFMTVLVFLYFVCSDIQIVYAREHQTGDNVVYKESAPFVELNFPFIPNVGQFKYYVDDATGIPSGGDYYFWKYGDNDKFAAISKSNIFSYVLNNGLGITASNTRLAELQEAYYRSFLNLESGFLFDGQGNKLGICLNDITGCVYENYPQNTDISIPNTEINNIYNWYQYYINNVSPEVPDYINVQTYKASTALTLVDVSDRYVQSYTSILNGKNGLFSFFNVSNNQFWYYRSSFSRGMEYLPNGNYSYYSGMTASSWSSFCANYDLKNNGDGFGYTDVLLDNSNSNNTLDVFVRDNDSGTNLAAFDFYSATQNNSNYNTYNYSASTFPIVNGKYFVCSDDARKITIYKDSTMFTSIVNKTYSPQYYTSEKYYNYDSNTQTNLETNTSVVNNSTNNNSSIYNDASQSFQNYYSSSDNYNIDNSVVIENTTEIIYNYYGDDSGGGGNGGNDDDNGGIDDAIWAALLKAIADFFKKIGELIVTVLTGIVTIFNSILDAMAQIVTGFTGITDFFTQVFSWLPSEIVALMTLGLAMALFAAFISWFKK